LEIQSQSFAKILKREVSWAKEIMCVAIIPARAGSKGIIKKNERLLCGKPLIAWSILTALKSEKIERVLVSTDGENIAEIAESYGAEVLLRSKHLATDEAKTIDVLHHHLDAYREAETLVVLQPTSPVRNVEFLDTCINLFQEGQYTNLATGFYCKYKEYGSHNNVRRQDVDGFFYDDGSIYVLKRSLVKARQWTGTNKCAVVGERFTNYEIDDEIDWLIVESLMTKFLEGGF